MIGGGKESASFSTPVAESAEHHKEKGGRMENTHMPGIPMKML